jgi:thiamine-phosphate pyrophosphorylase
MSMRTQFVTDPELCRQRGLVETASAAMRGGIDLVQLRDPFAKGKSLLSDAFALKAALAGTPTRLIVNDRPDIAIAVDAAGVHVGQSDLPATVVRSLIGPGRIIGLSVSSMADLQNVPWDVVDYLGVGPVFGPGVKQNAAATIGLDALQAIARAARCPVVAIGGVSVATVQDCLNRGASGVAVVSAIASASDPEAAARAIAETVARHHSGGRA